MARVPQMVLRTADAADAAAVHTLISAHVDEGHLLRRSLEEIERHIDRFIVVTTGEAIVACAELARLSATVAEVRSLAVAASARRRGVGAHLVEALRQQAVQGGFDRLCAFTHAPGYFIPMGFSIVPHLWIREKVFTDCVHCLKFRQCGQYAMEMPLDGAMGLDERDERAHPERPPSTLLPLVTSSLQTLPLSVRHA